MHAEPSSAIQATISASAASERSWDVAVIGAGPAGALAARQLVVDGHRVLLIDKRSFPRDKVCGACFSDRCAQALQAAGLDDFLPQHSAVPIHRVCVSSCGRQLDIPVRGSWALSRTRFDAALVRAAIDRGVAFLPEVVATVMGRGHADHRRIRLTDHGHHHVVSARVIVAADGLASPSTAKINEFPAVIARRSRIGLGTTFESNVYSVSPNTIHMMASPSGYVGAVQVEDGRTHFAAAVDSTLLRSSRSTHEAVGSLLGHFHSWPPAGGKTPVWYGTPPLTRTVQRPVSHRIFLVGDAAGYVEPFTGEGIAWALESAIAVTPYVSRGLRRWDCQVEDDWQYEYATQIRSRQTWCRAFAYVLHHPRLTRAALFGFQQVPALASVLARRILNG